MFIWRNGETVIRGFSRVPLYIWFLYKGIILQIFIARLRMRKKKTGGEPASGGTVCKADLFSVSESGKQPAAVYSGRTGGINLQKTVDNTVIRWYSQMVVKKQVEYPLSPKRNRAT